MKRFTFLMSLLLISGMIFGQSLVPERTRDFVKIKGDPIEQTKDLTIIWEDDFSNPDLWVTAYDETNPNDGPWVIGTDGPSGYYSDGMGPIESTTAANGFAMFDSDATGIEVGEQDSKLIYHTAIDCFDYDAVAVSFESYYRAFNGNCYIEVSTDSSTWEQFQVHEDIEVNSSTANPEIVTVNISNIAANQSEVYFRFRYIGEWDYAWMVDDIQFFVAPDHDLKLLDARVNFYPKYIDYGYSGFYGKIPQRQFQSANAGMFFNGVPKNLGTMDASPSLNTTVLNPFNDEIFNNSADLGAALATGENDTISLTDTLNVTDPMLGTYTWNFEAYEDGVTEENPVDNTISYQTEITPNYYAHNNGNVTGGWSTENYTDGGNDGDMVGVIYTFLEPDTIKKAHVYISSMTSVNTSFVVKILEWDEDASEWSEELATGVHNISDESQTDTLWEVDFPGNGYDVEAADGLQEVMVAVEYYYGGGDSFRVGIDGSVPTSGYETYMYFINDDTWYYYGGDHVPIIDIETYEEDPNTETDILTYTFPEHNGTPIDIDTVNHTVDIEVEYGTDLADLVAEYTLSYGATADIGGTPQESGVTANDFSSPVTYTITAEDGTTTQDWVVTVTEEPPSTETDILDYSLEEETGPATIDEVNHTVDIEVEYGTDMANLVATYELSEGATADIGGTPQESGVTANDFSSDVTYTITAEDGTTTQDWVVTVTEAPPSTETDILLFSLDEQTGPAAIDDVNHTVDVEVVYGTDLTTLVPTFELSLGATAEIASVVQESGVTTVDFTNPVTYTIIAQDGTTTQDWTVTVAEEPPSTETDILDFALPEQTGAAAIDDVNHTVDVEVAFGTDLTTLVPTFALSEGATAEIGGVVQESGITTVDFTDPVTYTVIAQDGTTTQDWTVTVTAESGSSETDFLAYSFDEQTDPADIDPANHTITVNVSTGTDVTALVATFTLSDGATAEVGGAVQESGVTANDFTDPVTYTVIAEDGVTTEDWVVTVTVGLNIEDMLSADMTVHPNPNNGNFVLEMGLKQKEDVSLSIISTTGQVVFHAEFKDVNSINRVIELGNVSDGIYNLRVKAGSKLINHKIIVNK